MSKTKQRGRPLECNYIITLAYSTNILYAIAWYYIHCVGGYPALLVSTFRAMREPQHVERVTVLAPRLNQNRFYNVLIISYNRL